jgi:hypothetical protein
MGLECRRGAASADAQKMINVLKAKIDRIASLHASLAENR